MCGACVLWGRGCGWLGLRGRCWAGGVRRLCAVTPGSCTAEVAQAALGWVCTAGSSQSEGRPGSAVVGAWWRRWLMWCRWRGRLGTGLVLGRGLLRVGCVEWLGERCSCGGVVAAHVAIVAAGLRELPVARSLR